LDIFTGNQTTGAKTQCSQPITWQVAVNWI